MTVVAVGRICDVEGMAIERLPRGSILEMRSIPSSAYLVEQPHSIPVDCDHDSREVGEVEYLERTRDGLWAVAECAVDELGALSGPFYWSAGVAAHSDDRGPVWEASSALLRSLSLTFQPAQLGALPVTVIAGDLDVARHDSRWTPEQRALVERAVAYSRRRAGRRHEAHRIFDPVDMSKVERLGGHWLYDGELIPGSVEVRSRSYESSRDRPKNLAADIEGGVFAVNVGKVEVAPRAKLMYGVEPVGMHWPEADRPGAVMFTVTASARGIEALTLVADGVHETASPLCRLDGRCTAVQIDLD